MAIRKPQSPLKEGDIEFFPLTDASQVINGDERLSATLSTIGNRLDDKADKTELNSYVLKTMAPFRFGIDANGNYGYYKVGADSVTPFSPIDLRTLNKNWHFKTYATSTNGATNLKTAPTKANWFTDDIYLVAEGYCYDFTVVNQTDGLAPWGELGVKNAHNSYDYYNTYLETYVYVSADTSETYTWYADDYATMYVNGAQAAQITGAGSASKTWTFKKGWNHVEIYFYEVGGAAYMHWNVAMSNMTNVTGMNPIFQYTLDYPNGGGH